MTRFTYGAAGGILESRWYNARLQLTRMTTTPDSLGNRVDLEYRYASGQNNGRITQRKNWVSGEEVSYQYDSLQRLSSAVTTGPEWGLSFSYDGFGNKTAQTVTKGTGPAMTAAYDGFNRMIGVTHDSNGNMYGTTGTVVRHREPAPNLGWSGAVRVCAG